MKIKSVLVIERDHEARVLIRRALEDRGHFVISATSGAEAIVLLEKMSVPALILLNPHLNYMDPQGFVNLIRRMAGFENIPFGQIGISETPLAGLSCMTNTDDLSPVLKFLEA